MGDRHGRYSAHTGRLVDSVLSSAGHTGTELRRAALARAARLSGCSDGLGRSNSAVPDALAGYVDKVALHAYEVTDDDLVALQRTGNSDDALFEITVAAAVGAALGRLERGIAALSSPPDLLSATLASPPDPLSATRRGGAKEAP